MCKVGCAEWMSVGEGRRSKGRWEVGKKLDLFSAQVSPVLPQWVCSLNKSLMSRSTHPERWWSMSQGQLSFHIPETKFPYCLHHLTTHRRPIKLNYNLILSLKEWKVEHRCTHLSECLHYWPKFDAEYWPVCRNHCVFVAHRRMFPLMGPRTKNVVPGGSMVPKGTQ